MKSVIFSLGVLAFAVLGLRSTAHADLNLTVDTVVADAGDNNVLVTVSAADPDGVGSLGAYAFALDFGTTGLGLGPNLTFAGNINNLATANFDSFSSVAGLGVAGANYDLQVNAGGFFTPALALNSAPTPLFSLEFDVGTGAVPGDFFDVAVLPFGAPFGSQPNELFVVSGTDIGGNEDATVTPGGISLGAAVVPEPSSLALLAVGACGMAVRRRRTRV